MVLSFFLKFIVHFVHSVGISTTYVLTQAAIWCLFHLTFLFRKVVFPFHNLSPGKIKFIYITCILVAIILPLAPICATISAFAVDIQKQSVNSTSKLSLLSGGLGYNSFRFPPLLCTGTNVDAYFYSTVFPFCTIVSLGLTLLLITFWTVRNILMRNEVKD